MLIAFFCCTSGQVCAATAYDKNGIRLLLHFAANKVAGRPDVLVMVASMLSTAPLLVKDVRLQVAVPKVKRQHAPNIFKLHVVCFASAFWPFILQNEVSGSMNKSVLPLSPSRSFLPDDESETATAVGDGAGSL